MKIDGKEIAQKILPNLKKEAEKIKNKGIIPHLYIITLTDDSASSSYINQKKLRAEELGIKITVEALDKTTSTEKLIEKIDLLNADSAIHGIIVQRPMPKEIDEEQIENAVDARKDIDGFNKNSKFITPVAFAVWTILKKIHSLSKTNDFETWLKEKNITVVGKGVTAGGPIIRMLEKKGIKPNVIDSKTQNRDEILKLSDIVISAVGKEKVVSSSNLKKGVILIGVGMHLESDRKFHGDYEESEIENIASFYTPTPKGVGPVNVVMLMKNLLKSAKNSLDKSNKNHNNLLSG